MIVWQNAINIAIDFFGVFLCLFAIIGMLISKKIIKHRYKVFIMMLNVETLALISNILVLIFNGKQNSFAKNATPIFCFSEFFFSILLSAMVSYYIISTICPKRKKGKYIKYVRITNFIYLVNIIMLVVSQFFNNLYYFIDENNTYHRAETF